MSNVSRIMCFYAIMGRDDLTLTLTTVSHYLSQTVSYNNNSKTVIYAVILLLMSKYNVFIKTQSSDEAPITDASAHNCAGTFFFFVNHYLTTKTRLTKLLLLDSPFSLDRLFCYCYIILWQLTNVIFTSLGSLVSSAVVVSSTVPKWSSTVKIPQMKLLHTASKCHFIRKAEYLSVMKSVQEFLISLIYFLSD